VINSNFDLPLCLSSVAYAVLEIICDALELRGWAVMGSDGQYWAVMGSAGQSEGKLLMLQSVIRDREVKTWDSYLAFPIPHSLT
jgi:hypothetical protein